MQSISINNRIGIWVIKQGSINTVLADGTAMTMLAAMRDESVSVRVPDSGKYAIMAIKSTKIIYKLFAFELTSAEKELTDEALIAFRKWQASQ